MIYLIFTIVIFMIYLIFTIVIFMSFEPRTTLPDSPASHSFTHFQNETKKTGVRPRFPEP